LVNHQFTTILALALSFALSACVTQNFENGETPVVQNQANRDDMAATRISLGLGYLKMGNMPQAKQNLEKAKNFSPNMVQVYTAFAHYYETVGEDQLTIESYEKALSLKSEDADTLNNYGVYLCRQDQLEAAEKQFLKAIAVPSYLLVSKSYENLASCFLQKNNFDKAEVYLHKAIMHSPNSASVLFQMVRLQYAMGEYQLAKNFEQRFEKVTRRFTPQSLALAFKVYIKLGQHRTAKNYGTMLVKMYPQSWEAQQYLLNELELIDADNLAKRYQLTQVKKQDNKPKKRIVKLSPKKKAVTHQQASKSGSHSSSVNETPAVAKQVATPIEIIDSAISTSIATTQAINVALSMSPETEQLLTENVTTNSEPQLAQPSVKTVKHTDVVRVSTQDTEKRVVVLRAPNKVAPNTTESAIQVVSDNNDINSTAEKTQALNLDSDSFVPVNEVESIVAVKSIKNEPPVLAKKSAQEVIPQEDREIFHVAKKPEPIIENPVEKSLFTKTVQTEASGTKVAESDSDKDVEAVNIKKPAVHIVGKGDTLFGISIKYNVKIKTLRRWNKLSTKKKIRVNDKLFVENPIVVTQVNE